YADHGPPEGSAVCERCQAVHISPRALTGRHESRKAAKNCTDISEAACSRRSSLRLRQCLIQPMLRSRQLTSRKTTYRLVFQKGGNRFQELRPPSVWPVQMKKMGSAGNDYNLHSSTMNKIGCEMFPIFLTRPEISAGCHDQRRRDDERSIPELPSDDQVETIFHSTAGRAKAWWRSRLGSWITPQRRFNIGVGYCRIAPLALVFYRDAVIPGAKQ